MENDKIQTQNSKIEALQVVRCFSFLGVFLCHTGFDSMRSLGGWGVSVFIILSGFLMSFNYCDKNRFVDFSVKSNFLFGIKKIMKLYPLHLITMLTMVVFSFLGNGKEAVTTIFTKLVLNIMLLQEWFPIQNREINGMSWFLCEILFFYFLYPWIFNYMNNKMFTIKKARIWIIVSIFIMFMIGFCSKDLNVVKSVGSNSIYVDDLRKWIIYYFPLVRFIEFFIGCNLGFIYLKTNYHYSSVLKMSFYRIVAIMLVILSNVIYCCYSAHRYVEDNNIIDQWWIYTFIFVISSCFLIYAFATKVQYHNKRKAIPMLDFIKKIVLQIADLSPYAFLIHTVVFRYLSVFYYHIPGFNGDIFYYEYGRYFNLTIGFFITMILSYMYSKRT